VRITYDSAKREANLQKHGLDFEDAPEVFEGDVLTLEDDRYSEARYRTYGYLHGLMVLIAWTQRGSARRVISMRKANAKEQARIGQRLGEAGRDDR
jgi:uncharacterized protein